MERSFREQLCFLLLSVSVLRGCCRDLEVRAGPFTLLKGSFAPPGCMDMVAVEGQFTFTAETPHLSCATFLMAEPSELISVEFGRVDIDCSGGDFITVFDGWVMKGEKFPSSQDHPLPLYERYVDYCDSAPAKRSVRSSQNVAMVFFRVHSAGSSFTLTVRKHVNLFPCNAISQSPEGSYTMVIPQQRRNCSFSILYPVAIDISEYSLGRHSSFPKVKKGGRPLIEGFQVRFLPSPPMCRSVPTLPLVEGWRQCSPGEPPPVCEWVIGTVTVKRFGPLRKVLYKCNLPFCISGKNIVNNRN
uniref:Corticotropin-releasing factor-binding protein n=1 Tax=Oryzias sinensis TaxID=183150 RepID=A0A8C7XZ25_9TELE